MELRNHRSIKNRILIPWLAAMLLCCWVLNPAMTAHAAGEKVYFGSEAYEWELGETSYVGIYAEADGELETVDLTVAYDDSMIIYDSGGSWIDDGRVQVQAESVGDGLYQEMLSFETVMAGETEISITEANVGEEGEAAVSLAEVTVAVSIPIPTDCMLETITVDGEEIAGFDPETANYTIDLDEYSSELDVEAAAADADVEISDTALAEGENTIAIYTTDSDGNQARYLLTVNNPDSAPAAGAVTETEADGAGEGSYDSDRSRMRMNVALVIITCVLIVIVALLLRSRKRRKNRKQKFRTPQKRWGLSKGEYQRYMDEFQKRNVEVAAIHVSMDFRREKDEPTSIKEMFIRAVKGQREVEHFRALDDISFAVKRGDVVGIIGTNGSGKSTLLKIISGVLSPTNGIVFVDNERIHLLTLGTGFDFELTGRENVYLNGAIIGYTREFIDSKYDEIVGFAELEGFMDEKVRNYSSGMVSRLAFAIATVQNEPSILILDEVFAVGDMFFREKCEKRIQELIHNGSTVLIVAHGMDIIRKNCNKAIWLEKSHIKMMGDPDEVCDAYARMGQKQLQ